MSRKRNKTKKINRAVYLALVCVTAVLGLFTAGSREAKEPGSTAASRAGSASSVMEVDFIDVGQADCILVQSEGRYMLIDAGNNGDGGLVVEYLKAAGVETLDYIIATHPHEDHIGGMDDVIDNFAVETIFMPDIEHTTKTFEDMLEAMARKGLEITLPKAGEKYTVGKADFTIVAPNRMDYGDELNDYSVGIHLVNGNNRFLMCGDAEAEAEADILKNNLDIKSDVYKVSHHGSRYSTTDAFLKAISPEYAVIQCGEGNTYEHPHEETLESLEKAGVTVFRTDLNGTVTAVSDGESITWETEKQP